MTETITLEPIDGIEVQTLMDNASDLLLRSEDRARRPSLAGPGGASAPTVEAPLFLDPKLPEMLIAEHGFSALVTVTKGGRTHRVMFDAGLSVGGLSHNLHALQISVADIEAIVLEPRPLRPPGRAQRPLIRDGGVSRLPMLLHPDFWLARRIAIPGQGAVRATGPEPVRDGGCRVRAIEGREPSLLMDGSVLITGEVDRTTEFEKGFPGPPGAARRRVDAGPADPRRPGADRERTRQGARRADRLRTLGHRQHRAARAEAHGRGTRRGRRRRLPPQRPRLCADHPATIDALKAFAPSMIVPGHCTGYEAARAISLAMPEAFVVNSVGTRYVI